jgi:iron complex transport system substrate-binding protein
MLAVACLAAPARGAVTVRDDMGHAVTLARAARRVVSLAPNTTEMLYAISAQGELVGVSKEDDYPPAARKLPKVGSFSGPDLERIVAARPDLIVAAYGNPLALIDRLRRLHLPVYVSNPSTVEGVLRNISDLGRLTGRDVTAHETVHALEARLRRVAASLHGQPPVKTLVVIWDEPLTVAGGKSYIQDIVHLAGGVNAAASLSEAYPKLDPERLLSMDPEVVLFPVAGDPTIVEHQVERLEQRPGFRQTRAARTGRFYTPNPDWLMRPGPRVVLGVEAVARLLHPLPSHHQTSN